MENIDTKINRLLAIRKTKLEQLEKLDSENEENKVRIAILNNQVTSIDQELKILEEKKLYQKNPSLRIPRYGDSKYQNYPDKEALDMLRVLYYEQFHQEPNISRITSDYTMFGDETLPIYVSTYSTKSPLPFKIMFETKYKDYKPKPDYALGIILARQLIAKEENEEYIHLILELFKKYTTHDLNFICGDGQNKTCTLAYIGENDFSHHRSKEKDYYEFFNLLCDNLYRNIIYVGDTMKENAKESEIELVQNEFILPHIDEIARYQGITTPELTASNERIKKYILDRTKNTN